MNGNGAFGIYCLSLVLFFLKQLFNKHLSFECFKVEWTFDEWLSRAGHAFEPVLEIKEFIDNTAVILGGGVAELLVGLLRVLLGPGYDDL